MMFETEKRNQGKSSGREQMKREYEDGKRYFSGMECIVMAARILVCHVQSDVLFAQNCEDSNQSGQVFS